MPNTAAIFVESRDCWRAESRTVGWAGAFGRFGVDKRRTVGVAAARPHSDHRTDWDFARADLAAVAVSSGRSGWAGVGLERRPLV